MEPISLEVIEKLIDVGIQSAGVKLAPGSNVPYVMIRKADGSYEPKSMPELVYNSYEKPLLRIQARVGLNDSESFQKYYNLYRATNSLVFADEKRLQIAAVLDYHKSEAPPAPRNCQHTAILILGHSEPWKVWAANNNRKFTQSEFAEFLEQYAMDITNPSPAHMMEVARDLQATTEVEFGSALRQNDGQVRFKYTETTKSSVGASQMACPENFTLSIPVFTGSGNAPVNALLRFRVNQGKLTIWYTMIRPEEIIRRAFIAVRDEISTELGIDIINGTPTA